MPLKLNAKGGLIRCGRCGRRYSNPLSHVCAGRRTGQTKVAPKVSVSARCPKCGKSYANPLTHACTVKTDFGKRKADDVKAKRAAARKAKAAARPQHRYTACRDEDCQRIACEAYRDGYQTGFAEGLATAEESK